ncbi:hypothetical protein [Clostridium sp.]|uniref:hypothetical protein n=1 Tax=Clostridium sp. TaxID=1506 RepID=UPI002847577E|nr:hypothetical protein [Clostridium sp.]MDR3595874.1 hypothetical protein [Clostridium sp.]
MKKKTITTLVTTLMLIAASVPVFASSYSSYRLGPVSENNYTGPHQKVEQTQCITNNPTAMSNVSGSEVTFWACDDDKNQWSKDYVMRIGQNTDIRFTSEIDKGQYVIMGMEATHWSKSTGYVSGNVNFH